ncbi:hypothetical protein PoB_005712700 [Plakobranchus ocellatus]|uniref:Uncharacterized protein n=1 Tax=Plakobranchus ocellatus TaxID=259542 RepID=A0AAV4CGS8_9GAST|nr:hypothetical protein PoB_005712700 [Plakobranchus ocellatus]
MVKVWEENVGEERRPKLSCMGWAERESSLTGLNPNRGLQKAAEHKKLERDTRSQTILRVCPNDPSVGHGKGEVRTGRGGERKLRGSHFYVPPAGLSALVLKTTQHQKNKHGLSTRENRRSEAQTFCRIIPFLTPLFSKHDAHLNGPAYHCFDSYLPQTPGQRKMSTN